MTETIKKVLVVIILVLNMSSADAQQWKYDSEYNNYYIEHLMYASFQFKFEGYDSTIFIITQHKPSSYWERKVKKKKLDETLISTISLGGKVKFVKKLKYFVDKPIIHKDNGRYFVLDKNLSLKKKNYIGFCYIYSKDWEFEKRIKITFPRDKTCDKYQNDFKDFTILGNYLYLLTDAYNTGKEGRYLPNNLIKYSMYAGFEQALSYPKIEISDLWAFQSKIHFQLNKRLVQKLNNFQDSIANITMTTYFEVIGTSSEIKKDTQIALSDRPIHNEKNDTYLFTLAAKDFVRRDSTWLNSDSLLLRNNNGNLLWSKAIGPLDANTFKPLPDGSFIGEQSRRYLSQKIIRYDFMGKMNIVKSFKPYYPGVDRTTICHGFEYDYWTTNKIILFYTKGHSPNGNDQLYVEILNFK